MLAPVREWRMGREEEIAYAREHRIPISGRHREAALLDRRQPLGPLLGGRRRSRTSTQPPPDDVFQLVTPPEQAPDEPETVRIGFEAGRPVSLDGERLGLVELIDAVSELGRRHGVGIVDHIEDRIVGLKVRDLYEVPAATIILAAHRDLEKLVSTIHQNNFKAALDTHWAYLCYAGLWHEPLRPDLDAFMESANELVTGEVTVKLFKGAATRRRPQLALRALRQVAGRLRRVGRRVQPEREPRVHRAVHAAEPDGAPGPQRMTRPAR